MSILFKLLCGFGLLLTLQAAQFESLSLNTGVQDASENTEQSAAPVAITLPADVVDRMLGFNINLHHTELKVFYAGIRGLIDSMELLDQRRSRLIKEAKKAEKENRKRVSKGKGKSKSKGKSKASSKKEKDGDSDADSGSDVSSSGDGVSESDGEEGYNGEEECESISFDSDDDCAIGEKMLLKQKDIKAADTVEKIISLKARKRQQLLAIPSVASPAIISLIAALFPHLSLDVPTASGLPLKNAFIAKVHYALNGLKNDVAKRAEYVSKMSSTEPAKKIKTPKDPVEIAAKYSQKVSKKNEDIEKGAHNLVQLLLQY